MALLVRKNVFHNSNHDKKNLEKNKKFFSREDALITLMSKIPKIPKISTTGMLSRELNEFNLKII